MKSKISLSMDAACGFIGFCCITGTRGFVAFKTGDYPFIFNLVESSDQVYWGILIIVSGLCDQKHININLTAIELQC